jgi:hypothetical protein
MLPWCRVTYAKFGAEFPERLAADSMSDAAFRTHAEAIMWVYHVEAWDLRVPKHMLRRITTSIDWETAVKDLVAAGYWADGGNAWVIRHHRQVIVASLTAQAAKRERDRKAQAARRARLQELSTDIRADASAYQTDSQTGSQSAPKGKRMLSRSAPDWPLVKEIVRIVHADPCGGIDREDLAEKLRLPARGRYLTDALMIAYRNKKIDFCREYVVKPVPSPIRK